jgi:hypothetical protein
MLIQFMYLVFYISALARLESIPGFVQMVMPGTGWTLPAIVLVSAAVGIAVRLYLLTTVCFNHPELGEKISKIVSLVASGSAMGSSPFMVVNQIGWDWHCGRGGFALPAAFTAYSGPHGLPDRAAGKRCGDEE